MSEMTSLPAITSLMLIIGVVAVLAVGLFGMIRQKSPASSQRLMRWRVLLQGAAIGLLFAALWWNAP